MLRPLVDAVPHSQSNYFDQGWHHQALKVQSPHFNDRPCEQDIELIVIHAISLPPGEFGEHFIEDFFCNRLDASTHPYFLEIQAIQVSSHFLIKRDGQLIQFVSVDKRAWHAGRSNWQDRIECNDFSVGIELEGCDDQAFTHAQYPALAQLIQDLIQAYPRLKLDKIVGHSDIAPGRKTDPGPCFDWDRLHTTLQA